jgi:hypothetical protein
MSDDLGFFYYNSQEKDIGADEINKKKKRKKIVMKNLL